MPQSRTPRPKSQEVLEAEERARRDPAFAAALKDGHGRSASTPDWVRATNQGFTFNNMDELDAWSAGKETDARNWLADRGVGTRAPYDGQAAHDAVLVTEREAYENANPLVNVGFGWAGAGANPLVRLGGAVVKGAPTLMDKVVESMAFNGVFGGLNGAGSGKTGSERVKNALNDGLAGAVVGAVQPQLETYVLRPVATRLGPAAAAAADKVANSPVGRAVRQNEFGRRFLDIGANAWDGLTQPGAMARPLGDAAKPELAKGVDVLKALFDHDDDEDRRRRR